MKRIISLVLLLALVSLILCGCSDSSGILNKLNLNGYVDGIRYQIVDNEAVVTGTENKTTVTEIIIPDEYEGLPVTEIADFGIVNLEYAVSIHIGKNVKEIGEWAMTNNQHITKITVSEENEYFCDIDGVLYSKDMKTVIYYPPSRNIVTTKDEDGNDVNRIAYVIPDGVEEIRTKAFYKCYCLTDITIPESVKLIGEKSFFHCSLQQLNLPEGTETIEKDAFGFNYSLQELTIGPNIKEIGEYAFYNCTNLLKIEVQAKESEIALGKKWYPTNNGIEIDELEVIWYE